MQHDFSFGKFFVYMLRKWFVVLAAAVVGLTAGLLYSLVYETTTISVFEATIRFSVFDYYELHHGGTVPGEGDDSFYDSKAADAAAIMSASSVASRTYDAVKDKLYPTLTAAEKTTRFFDDLVVANLGNAVRIDFAYNIGNDGKNEDDKKIAAEVVKTYVIFAREAALEQIALPDTLTEENKMRVLSASSVVEVYGSDTAMELMKSNTRPSPVKFSLIGIAGGLVLGVLIVVAIYLCDPRIKSLGYVLPEGVAGAVYAGTFGSEDSLAALRATVYASGKNKLLIASTEPDANAARLAELFASYLNAGGHKANFTVLGGGESGADWKSLFGAPGADAEKNDAFEIYAFTSGDKGAVGYISGRVGATVFVLNERTARAKKLVAAIGAVGDSGAEYLGAVVYGLTDSWLD